MKGMASGSAGAASAPEKDAQKPARQELDRILASAHEMAQKITAEAEKTAESEILRARTELRQEASRLAITLAEELLKKQITAGDQQRLVDEYVSKVGELH